jgi:hypothetical protein
MSVLDMIGPTVSGRRAAYPKIFEKRSMVQRALDLLLSSIAELELRNTVAETPPPRKDDEETSSNDLSTSTLDSFSTELENILKSWDFPDTTRV